MVLTRSISGKMVKDASPYSLRSGDYLDARNITVAEKAGVARGAYGNRAVSVVNLPQGECKVLGRKEDATRNRIFYFVWNENGYHTIFEYNAATNATRKILQNLTDTGNVDLLGWNKNIRITSIVVVRRSNKLEEDLLYWAYPQSSPKGLLIEKIASGSYGTVTIDLIEAAKRPPLFHPVASYGNDEDRTVNTMRRKLYQFQYRFVYDTFEKSTWSPFSIVALPAGLSGTDNEMVANKNNFIQLGLKTGGVNVTDIEIAVRENIGSAWSDTALAASLNKELLGIPHNASYEYRFYNDGLYPPLDPKESILLFDWVPRFADVLELVNGNTMLYTALTEGYNPINQNELNVSLTTELVRNSGVDLGPLTITYYKANPYVWNFNVKGLVTEGTYIFVIAQTPTESLTLAQYTTKAGDTIPLVVQALSDSIPSQYKGPAGYGNDWFQAYMDSSSQIIQLGAVGGQAGADTGIVSPSTWNWWSRYKFALVYYDEQGRTIGAQSKATTAAGINQFEVETPGFQTEGGVAKTPIIKAEISHRPPAYAKSFQWVRSKNLAFDKYFYYGTHDFQQDTDFYYFGLQNVQLYKEKNNKFIYGNIESIVAEGDRFRVISTYAGVGFNYGSYTWGDDYEILGLEDRVISGDVKGKYVKVRKPKTAPAVDYNQFMHVVIYSPAKNVVSADSLLYSEFGQSYPVIAGADGNLYHGGGTQDQDATKPAKFTFTEGDMYFRDRTIYMNGLNTLNVAKVVMADANYSDFYNSAVNSNGRAQVRDVNARETYFPTVVRFSQSSVEDTNINQLNRFYFDNYKQYDRSFGEIVRMRARDKQLRIFQRYKCGAVPVYTQIMKDASGNESVLQSDQLLNDIQYYAGEFGIGSAAASLASNNYADYFVDNMRGVICRLSLDGLTPISITEGINQYAIGAIPGRGHVGVFDARDNRYIVTIDGFDTISFNESRNGFESNHDYMPEMYASLNNKLYSFLSGSMYIHDEQAKRCNYYGVQYAPVIEVVYNDGPQIKKKFDSAMITGTAGWACEIILTSTDQLTSLRYDDFRKKGGLWYAPLMRDTKSPGGISRGDKLEGNYIQIRYKGPKSGIASEWVFGQVVFIPNNLNNR